MPLLLTRAQVRALLDFDSLLDALSQAFVGLSAGRASVPPRIAARVPGRGLLGAMPAYVNGVLSTKLVSVFPGNHAQGLPSHQALIALFDPETGAPLAILDGTEITAARTAAVSALATRLLAREDARVLAVLGTGVQARAHLDALPRVRQFHQIRVAGRTPAHAAALAADFGAVATASFEAAVRGADVVCACTDADRPILRREWLSPGAHVTSVGFGGPELDSETISAALATGRLAVESRAAFAPPPAGAHELQGLDPAQAVELGELLSGLRPARRGPDELTVFKSVGNAVEDAVAAALVFERARTGAAGQKFEL